MSGPIVIGPQQPIVNTVLAYSVPAETQAIYVQNYSRFTLLVSFDATKPTATDSLNNQYDGILAPGGRDTFYVQSRGASRSERSLNAMGAFTGKVWIMPVDRTSSLAFAGTASGNNDVWLSAYGPYDPPPPFPGGMPLNVDISSQQRVISLPPPGAQLLTGTWTPVSLNPQSVAQIAVPAALAALAQTFYYLFHFSYFPTGSSTTSLTMQAAIQVQPLDSGFTNLGSPILVYQFVCGVGQGSTTLGFLAPINLTPHFPLATLLGLPANTAWLQVQLFKTGGSLLGGVFNLAGGIDLNNQGLPPSYGGQAGATRWAGQYSSIAGIW